MRQALVQTLILTAVYGLLAWRFVFPKLRHRALATIALPHRRHVTISPIVTRVTNAATRAAIAAPVAPQVAPRRHLRLVPKV